MYYRLFWHIFRENYHTIIAFLLYNDIFKKFFYYQSKSLDQTLVHCPIFLTAIQVEFSFCFRTNRAKYSLKFAKDLRLIKFNGFIICLILKNRTFYPNIYIYKITNFFLLRYNFEKFNR